jgi:glycosyltransferase involved in cell wall biosynthesis
MSILTKITHLTSAHPRSDIRIFEKMCKSLAQNKDYYVSLVVADGKGNETKGDVEIIDVGVDPGGRLIRMTKTVNKVFLKAKDLDSDIFHIHDPELIPIGLKLKKLGKKVIFDAHEDLPKQILSKPYLNGFYRKILSNIISLYEKYSCHKFDVIITATPSINEKFKKINNNSFNINNYPKYEVSVNFVDWSTRSKQITYIGSIGKIRGIVEIIKALDYTNGFQLNLAGQFDELDVKAYVQTLKSWCKVNDLGQISHNDVNILLSSSYAGIVTFLPVPNHVDAQPNKMFEYMNAGIPIITSNFKLWQDIVIQNECGICVDPLNPEEIGKAMQYLIDNPEVAKKMGENGREAVEKKYNWRIEEQKLFELYQNLVR